jgi:hypothetical protein
MFPLSKTRNAVILTAVLAAAIYLLLNFAAHTPRGRLNIVQFVAALFFLVIVIRQKASRKFAPAAVPSGTSTAAGDANARRRWLWLSLAAGAVVWSSMIPLHFISDDYVLLYAARGPLARGFWEMLMRGQEGEFLRPVGFVSIFLDYRLFHGWAPGYHLVNLAIHLLGVAGLFKLCENLGMETAAAGTAALFYAALPIQTEAVAWLGARFDQLSACLTIWTVVLYLKFRKTGSRGQYAAALLCFLLAALSKENAYALPLLLAAAEIFILRERRVKPAAGFFLLAAVLFVYRWAVLGGIGGYANTAGRAATFDLGLKTLEGLLIRGPAQMLLGFNWLVPPVAWVTLLASLTGAVLLVLALSLRPRLSSTAQPGDWKRLQFSLCWIVFTILPAHSVLMIGADLVNSRVLYLGTAGLAMLVSQVISRSGAESGVGPARRWIATGVLECLLLLSVLHNVAAWRSASRISMKFFSQLEQFDPSPAPNTEFVFSGMPHTIGGVFFFHRGLPEAINMSYGRDDLSAVREEDLPPGLQSGTTARHLVRFVWREDQGLLIAPVLD